MDENDETCVNIWVAKEAKLDSLEIEFKRKGSKSFSDSMKERKEKLRKAYNFGSENYVKEAQKKLDDDTRDFWQYSVNSSEVGNERKDTISLLDKLKEKWEELQDLYDEYKPIINSERELFKEKVTSHSSDGEKVVSYSPHAGFYGEDYTNIESLKIETWYFLTIEEATQHILFDQFLEFCLFIKNNESFASDIERLKKLFPLPDELILNGINNYKHFALDIEHLKKLFLLPDELILNGIKRKINQHKILERERKCAMVMKHFAKNGYFEWGFYSHLLPRIKEDTEFHDISDDISDDILKDWIRLYQTYLYGLPDMYSADCLKCFEHIIMQDIDTSYVIQCMGIKENWEIRKNDGLPYYNAFMNLQKKYGKIEISYFLTKQEKKLLLEYEEHIKSSPDYYNCSAEAIQSLKQRFPLPKDLIVNVIKRNNNRLKRAQIVDKFSDLLNDLLSNDCFLLNISISKSLQLIKENLQFSDLDDNILKEALGVYWALFRSPDEQSADFRKQNKDLFKSRIDWYCKNKRFGIGREWKLEENYLYYGTSEFPYGAWTKLGNMEIHSTFELLYRAPIKLGNMERNQLLKCIRWDQDKPITWKCRKTIEDDLDNQDVDEILSDFDVIEKEITRINSIISGSYEIVALRMKNDNPGYQ